MPLRNTEQEALFRVGPGTPSGEVFRRYWLPVETTANLGGRQGPVVPSAKNPIKVRVLGEDGICITGKGNAVQHSNVFCQTLDNVVDVGDREIAHGWYKGVPPVYGIHHERNDEPSTPMKFERTPWGACYVALQNTREP